LPSELVIFLDDGGVLNDNSIRGGEWRRLVGEFFPSRLGGTSEQWSEANRAVFDGLWQKWFDAKAKGGLVDTYHEWSRAYQLDWLKQMAEQVGVAVPPDEAEAFALAVEQPASLLVTAGLPLRMPYPRSKSWQPWAFRSARPRARSRTS
jgi:hypothetical protein